MTSDRTGQEVVDMTTMPADGSGPEGFNLRIAFYRRGAAVIETRGVARRQSAELLARVVRALARPGGVMVLDLCELALADYWLVSAVAKAHAAAHASRAHLRVVVGCRPVLDLLRSSGLERVVPVSECRGYDDVPGSAAQAASSRSADRQRIIDLSTHGVADRGRALAAGRARWARPAADR